MSPARARRAAWTAVDQALSSASNFGMAFLAARLLDAEGFGVFGIAFAVFLLALGVSRSVATDPLVVRFSAERDERAERSALGAAAGAGTAAGVLVVAAAALVGPSLRGPLVALAVVLPGLLVQDAVRFAAFARGDPRWAALSDGVWVLAEVGGALAVRSAARPEARAALLVLAWGLAAAAGAAAVLVWWRVRPALGDAGWWVRSNAGLAGRFTGEFAVTVGAGQLAVFFVAAFAGVSDAGSFRAGQVLLGPLNVVFMAASQFAVPEGVRLRRRDLPALRRGAVALAGLLAGSAVAGGAVWAAAPAGLGRALLAGAWDQGRAVVVPLSLAMAGSGVASVAYWGLRVLDAADRSLRVRVVVAPLIVGAGAAGAALAGARGAIGAMAAAQAVAAALAWRAFLGTWGDEAVRAGEEAGGHAPAAAAQPTGLPTTAA